MTVLRVLAVCSIVLALAASTPVACWCAPDDHHGQPLHPLFAHSHHPTTHDDVEGADAEPPELTAGWHTATPAGTPTWASGAQALVPPLWQALLAIGPGRPTIEALRPPEHLPLPLFPPPR